MTKKNYLSTKHRVQEQNPDSKRLVFCPLSVVPFSMVLTEDLKPCMYGVSKTEIKERNQKFHLYNTQPILFHSVVSRRRSHAIESFSVVSLSFALVLVKLKFVLRCELCLDISIYPHTIYPWIRYTFLAILFLYVKRKVCRGNCDD